MSVLSCFLTTKINTDSPVVPVMSYRNGIYFDWPNRGHWSLVVSVWCPVGVHQYCQPPIGLPHRTLSLRVHCWLHWRTWTNNCLYLTIVGYLRYPIRVRSWTQGPHRNLGTQSSPCFPCGSENFWMMLSMLSYAEVCPNTLRESLGNVYTGLIESSLSNTVTMHVSPSGVPGSFTTMRGSSPNISGNLYLTTSQNLR